MQRRKDGAADAGAETPKAGAELELPAVAEDESGGAAAESLRRLEAERDDLRDRWLRARADLDNAKKRAARDAGEQRAAATAEAVRAFLPVLDALDLALQHQAQAPPEYRTGTEMIKRQLEEALRRLGAEPIEAIGQPFDPHWHEAMEMVDAEGAGEGTVVAELQRGFRLHERLLRPARVTVARKSA